MRADDCTARVDALSDGVAELEKDLAAREARMADLGLAELMAEFAAPHTSPAAEATIGGYRLLSSRPLRRRPKPAPAASMPAHARMRATGFLSVLFVGGLGLAVLAGPANCPCNDRIALAEVPQASAPIAARFSYTKDATILDDAGADRHWRLQFARESTPAVSELPTLSTGALLEADNSVATSPISTSAIEPLKAAPARDGHALPARVLPDTIERLADTAPKPIRLAAVGGDESAVAPTLPVVEIGPPTDEVDAVEAKPETKPEPVAESPAARPRAHPRRRHAARLHKARNKASKIVRAPRWAAQMFETPWQSKAFSYIR